jgi:hypothetical protein
MTTKKPPLVKIGPLKMPRKTFLISLIIVGVIAWLIFSFNFHCETPLGEIGSKPVDVKDLPK